MTQPQVTVLIPTHNGERHLNKCLESLLAQTFPGWTAILADDCSSDETMRIARQFANDSRLKIISRPRNFGALANTNLLLADVESEYVALLHQDDWWEPEFLMTTINALDSAADVIIATTAVRVHGKTGGRAISGLYEYTAARGVVASEDALLLLVKPDVVYVAGVLARRALFQRAPLFEPSLPLAYDWHAWITAATLGDVFISDEVLANKLEHEGSISSRALRDNLWVHDLLRMRVLLRSSWASRGLALDEPQRRLNVTVWARILGQASSCAREHRRTDALFCLRLANSVAPSFGARLAGRLLILAASTLPTRLLAWVSMMSQDRTRGFFLGWVNR